MWIRLRWWRPPKPVRSRGLAGLALALSALAYGQTAPPVLSPGGQGEVAFQGSYAGGSAQPLLNITGTAFRFQELLPGVGLLSGDLEAYNSQTQFATGENFLELRGAPWMGQYWTVTGGDFRAAAALVDFPFNNIFTPEIDARGVEAKASHGDTQYSFFMGQETLTAGLRVAYRIMTPQTVAGVSAVRRLAPHLYTGVRLMQFSASPQSILDNPTLFPLGRNQPLTRNLYLQTLYTPTKRLKFYAEDSHPVTSEAVVNSVFGGAVWEGQALSLRSDYAHEGILYFPLAGYFAGDREGPYGEVRWRARKRLELFASADEYHNNLERDGGLPNLSSFGSSAGASGWLPGNLSVSATLSTLSFSQEGAGQEPASSNNRQLEGSLAKALRRHTLHADWREILLGGNPSQRQRSWEAGDGYQTKHFSLDGTMRYQQADAGDVRNSLFFRGLAQVNVGRISAYGNVEIGNDLANQTLFSTSAYRTSVIGLALRLTHGWNLQTELFRNSLNLNLNPQNIFLLENGPALEGISPLGASLTATQQWRVFFKLSKQIRWGAGLPSENAEHLLARAAVLTGSVEGMVRLKTLAGNTGLASIPICLDGTRTVVSGADGRYVFGDVPEGMHEVALSPTELPADFDPGDQPKVQVAVVARRPVSADFEVLPLVSLAGRVTGPDGVPLDGIVIRMAPGNRYTTTDNDGDFTFYNVREGDVVLALDTATLPAEAVLNSPDRVALSLRCGEPPPLAKFSFVRHSRTKPVRNVLTVRQ